MAGVFVCVPEGRSCDAGAGFQMRRGALGDIFRQIFSRCGFSITTARSIVRA
jgi:hypothetical protein